jgi:hypothetical protein
MTFDELLPQLVAAYERGRLVPFIGSGLSMPVCPSWKEFVEALELAIGGDAQQVAGAAHDSESLIRRANLASRALRLRDPDGFAEVVERALGVPRSDPPPQTVALAQLWWPLVMTTNYDNCFVTAQRRLWFGKNAKHGERPIEIVGRSPFDCQRVLASLTSPGDSLLWAVQGYLRAPCRDRSGVQEPDLSRELVIGHQEYRTVTNREVHFRRAFAEVYRTRSLFFLGSGLSEHYLLDLFGEVLEMYGPSTRPNYALVHKGEVDPEFMLARFHTVVCEYEGHTDLPDMLDQLHERLEKKASRPMRWSFAVDAPDVGQAEEPHEDLVIVRAPLRPPIVEQGECLVISAGERDGKVYFSPDVSDIVFKLGVRKGEEPSSIDGALARFHGSPNVVAVLARDAGNKHDLRNVFPVGEQLFEYAANANMRRLVMQLPAAGRNAPFPERFAFAQLLRAFGYWKRVIRPRYELVLELRIWQPAIYQELASGRMDVLELLSSEAVRFWVDIERGDGTVERRLFSEAPERELRELQRRLELPESGWTIEVIPAPRAHQKPYAIGEVLDRSLIDLGVVPGCTLSIRR